MNCRIEIKGLTKGEHRFTFHLDGSFFEAYESDIISDAAIEADALISKGEGRMDLDLHIEGHVVVRCDRCLADLELPVCRDCHFPIVFSSYAEPEEEADENDEVLVLDHSCGELDLSQIIYDYVNLSLPIRKVHPDGECDPEMIEKLKNILK